MSTDAAFRDALAGRYLIERELGQGGMATVYLAQDVRHDRKVALKVLLPELAAAVGQERFLREIRTAASLSHPHILPLHDSGEAAGTLFYVMPLATGESLRDRLTRESQLPIDEALQITRDVAGGLGYAHAQGVVHRDIKPENILLSAGHAVVADFGIAALLGAVGDSKLTSTGMSVGTPAYMSPEQAAGEAVDGRSDIYSLGCVLYELLAGTPPFTGPNVQAVVARHMTDPVPSIRTVRRTVPAALERVVMTALAKVPADRFATAAKFAAALPRHVDGQEDAPTTAPGEFGAGRRRVWAVATIVLVLLGALAIARPFGAFRTMSPGNRPITSLAVMPFQNLTGDTSQAFLAVSTTEQVVNALVRLSALRVIKVDGASGAAATSRLLKEHGFDAVLSGSITRSANTVRITVQYSSVETGQSLPGGGVYDGAMSDMLSVQDRVARSVADSIRISMTPQERSRFVADRRAVSPAAFEAASRGQMLLAKVTGGDLRQATAFYHRAVMLDSGYADAWVGLSRSYQRAGYFGLVPPAEAFPAARAAALRALSLDSTLGDAYATLGQVDFMFTWDFAAADRFYRKAIALSPGNGPLHIFFGTYLAAMGQREESIAELTRSQQIDPADMLASAAAARPFYNARRYDLAIEQSRKTLALDSNNSRARFWLGLSYEETGRLPEAIRELERTVALAPIPLNQAALGHAYAIGGERGKAQHMLQKLLDQSRSSYVSAFDIATINAGLGDRTRTLEALERAFNERASYLAFINVDPRFDAYRSEPRFRDLLRRMGLPARI